MHSIVASAATSGIFVPPTITATWGGFSGGVATFNLTNFNNSTTTYSVAMSSGTGTPSLNSSTGVVTVISSVNFETTITQRSIKGNLLGSSKILGKATITTYNVVSQGGCIAGATPEDYQTCQDACGGTGSYDGPGCCCAYQYFTNTYENSPPAGYQRIPTSGSGFWIRL